MSGEHRDQDAGGAPLQELTRRLSALEGAPVAEHPDVLDAVHAALIGELDGLAGAWRPAGPEQARRGP